MKQKSTLPSARFLCIDYRNSLLITGTSVMLRYNGLTGV